MTDERWTELMIAPQPDFTAEENAEGWHFCPEYDGLLMCEGPTPICVACGYAPTEFIAFPRVEPTELQKMENPVMATELYRHGEEDPLKALKTTLATSSRDASEARDIAWMYGIVCGWDEAALAELRAKFGWSVEQTDRLKRLHAAYEKLM